MKNFALITALILIAGCTDGTDDSGDSGNSFIPGGTTELPSVDEIKDALAGDKEECKGHTNPNSGEFTPVSGATLYFIGDLAFSNVTEESGDVTGTETIVIYPNEHWTTTDPDAAVFCDILFNIGGDVSFDDKCASCDYRLTLGATIDAAASSCTADVIAGYKFGSGDIFYDVTLACSGDDCTAQIQGLNSDGGMGSFTAEGNGASNAVTYVNSAGRCAFY